MEYSRFFAYEVVGLEQENRATDMPCKENANLNNGKASQVT